MTPFALQGRMNSIVALSSYLVSPVAPTVAGVMLGLVGINATLAAFAAVFGLGVALMLASRPIRSIGRPSTWAHRGM
ncbi:MAG TPA: hypothetical protein VIM10_14065 [Actinopolymorphaceae bacterium]